ncbi:MAG: hypothetical protein ACK5JT_17755 [Hyphomicrobiaceae bacterium]
MTRTKREAIAVVIAAVAMFCADNAASAQVPEPYPTFRRGDGTTYYREYKSKRPLRGHEGFYGPGPNLRYCSYMRIPNRKCDKRGCRVTSWTLQQTCY